MNTIFSNQSSQDNLSLLYAQAYLYNRIKIFSNVNFIISIVIPIILSTVAAVLKSQYGYPQEKISAYLGLYGLTVLSLNLSLSGYISSERKKAAIIQEMYDCNVLRIKWNDLRVGKKISRDNIFRAARYYLDRPVKAKARFGNEGWYINKTYDAPQSIMALLCHGKNLGWDRSLRDQLNTLYIFGLSVSLFSLVLYGMLMNASLNDGLFYIVFTLPLIRYFLQQFFDNRKSRDRIDKLKDYIDKEVSDMKISGRLNEDDLNYKLRSIQDEVFSHRVTSPSVPNFIHLMMKKDNEVVYDDYFEDHLKLMNFTNC
ncbi:S-4TM family putative pore-forming effector [Rouxiella badensis]|uniref:S-4TM family putative pore-forming effector n=1 Tax=Rouxiella badensis TaxID=1646377 RepID=UPI001D15ABEA|nr:S-4TM family putative pore-forming effector [Rouxiella badensis]